MSNNSRSARYRPWMPTAGQPRERGRLGATRLSRPTRPTSRCPPTAPRADLNGLWYSFRAGVGEGHRGQQRRRVPAGRRRRATSTATPAAPRRRGSSASSRRPVKDRTIDWIVVCMHQVAMSTAWRHLQRRRPRNPPGVDAAVRPVRRRPGRRRPRAPLERNCRSAGRPGRACSPSSRCRCRGPTIDTTKGTRHMIIGGGGTSAPSNAILTDPPVCNVITSVGPGKTAPGPGAPTGHFVPNYTQENASGPRCGQGLGLRFAPFSSTPATGRGARPRSTRPTTGSRASVVRSSRCSTRSR